MFIFEFNVRNSQVRFDCKIGLGDQYAREKLYEIYRKNSDVFSKGVKANGLLRPQGHKAFQKLILTKLEFDKYFENDSDAIKQIVYRRFRELMDKDIPKILGRINQKWMSVSKLLS